jgi:hypothetical protein
MYEYPRNAGPKPIGLPGGENTAVRRSAPAIEAIPLIKRRLAEIEDAPSDSVASGRRAALWRAQSQAARLDRTIADLRRYCLESLRPRRFIDEGDSEYLRGYREGFQLVLREIRKLESE